MQTLAGTCASAVERGRSGLCTKPRSPNPGGSAKLVSHLPSKVSEPEAEVRRALRPVGAQGDTAAARGSARPRGQLLLRSSPRRPWRGAVNKACLWEADLPLRPARRRPPRPSSALRQPPPAGWPGDRRGNGSTSQVKLCISCVLIAEANLGAQKGRDRRAGGGGAPGPTSRAGGRGARGPACARPARTAGRARRPRRGASRSARAPSCADSLTPRRRGARPRGGRGPRGCPGPPAAPFSGRDAHEAGRRPGRSGGLGSGCRKRFIMEPFIGSRWPGARTDSGEASMLV